MVDECVQSALLAKERVECERQSDEHDGFECGAQMVQGGGSFGAFRQSALAFC